MSKKLWVHLYFPMFNEYCKIRCPIDITVNYFTWLHPHIHKKRTVWNFEFCLFSPKSFSHRFPCTGAYIFHVGHGLGRSTDYQCSKPKTIVTHKYGLQLESGSAGNPFKRQLTFYVQASSGVCTSHTWFYSQEGTGCSRGWLSTKSSFGNE